MEPRTMFALLGFALLGVFVLLLLLTKWAIDKDKPYATWCMVCIPVMVLLMVITFAHA